MSTQHAGQSSTSVVISITNKLDATSSSPPKFTIFKVHQLLRKENKMAYEPEILAIGPYHRGKPRLQVMEDQKLRLLKVSLEQLGKDSDLSKYVEAMWSLEPKARKCYSESTSHVNEDEFVEMLLLDACFIIQFMRNYITPKPTEPCSEKWVTPDSTEACFEEWVTPDPNEPCFEEEWVISSVIRDMIIFENQIPLFVLEKLFSMIKLPDEELIPFHVFALDFLAAAVVRDNFCDTTRSGQERSNNHILGLLHDLLRSLAVSKNNPSIKAKWNLQHAIKLCEDRFKISITRPCRRRQSDQRDRKLNIDSIPSAAKLQAAGVEFRSKEVWESQLSEGEQLSIPFDISFKNGVMEIPTFSIDDSKESLYRNLIAYEQYNLKSSDRCVVLHAKLMDCLIDSAEDVALLRECGIIVNILGDDETVSTIFNKLVNHVSVSNMDSEVHSELFKEVNAYCGKRRHRWMAKLRRDYFNSPWALISFFAALFLLVLTLTQTVFSILGVL